MTKTDIMHRFSTKNRAHILCMKTNRLNKD